MPTFIALLRGVNVGKSRRVPMPALRELLAGLGHADVQTLLNSGNAVFHAAGGSAPAHARAIVAAIAATLALEVPVIVKSASELTAIAHENPFAGTADPSRCLVAFTQGARELAALAGIDALLAPGEGFALGRHAAYLHCAGGLLESRAGAALLGKLGRSATTRNWATTAKLQALAAGRGV